MCGFYVSNKTSKTKKTRRQKGSGSTFSRMKTFTNNIGNKEQLKRKLKELDRQITQQEEKYKELDDIYQKEANIQKTIGNNWQLHDVDEDEFNTVKDGIMSLDRWERQDTLYVTIQNILNSINPITLLYYINIDVLGTILNNYTLTDKTELDNFITTLNHSIDSVTFRPPELMPEPFTNDECYESPANNHHETWTGYKLEIPDYEQEYLEDPSFWHVHHPDVPMEMLPQYLWLYVQGEFCEQLDEAMGDIRLSLIIFKYIIQSNKDNFSEVLENFENHAKQINLIKRDVVKNKLNALIQHKRDLQDWQFQMIMKVRSIDNITGELPGPAMDQINKALGTDKKGGNKKSRKKTLKRF